MRTIIAFIQGMREFRVKASWPDPHNRAYLMGRDLMHALTFRKYEV